MLLRRFYDDKLAQASYMIGCQAEGTALIVDPNRDVQQYLAAAEEEGMEIRYVSETHIHADYLSGSRELARRSGATLLLSGDGPPDWRYGFAGEDGSRVVHDGDEIALGNIRIRILHTPGHTPEHISFMVTDGAASSEPMGILSGDFIFVGDVGRPDLLEKAAGLKDTMEQGARVLYGSLERFKELPGYLQVLPGHGAGSACGKALGSVPSSTLGYEEMVNWA
ncbi:MAG TPA: MBL fold metallo-hydrolase, partial [Longimicrobiales bacterium]|nr:MBL fold metallo-hydrolase [Longimicrobiales bacterium]